MKLYNEGQHFCRGLWSYGVEFCANTSIHGFNHIAASKRHWIERLLWLLVTAAAGWGAVSISLGQLQRYNDNPTVVTLEKDFRTWRFLMPAFTACAWNRTDPIKMLKVINTTWGLRPGDGKFQYYSDFISVVSNSDLYHLEGFQQYADDASLNVDLFKLAVDVMRDQPIKSLWSDGFNPKWLPTMTETGVCLFINSVANADSVIGTWNPNDTAQMPLTHKYSSKSCYVVFELDTDSDFYVHSPYDIMDLTEAPQHLYLTMNRVTELSVTETRCGRGVKDLAPKRRGCLYTDEPVETDKKVYSTNSCRRSCRNRLAIKLCGCKPFYNFYEKGVPCSASGMACLSLHAQELRTMAGEPCKCRAQCLDALFRDVIYKDVFWDKGPFTKRASVRFTVQAPRTRYTREIVFHFQDLVVSFGGAAGLFLGASFISFVEILYFPFEKMFFYSKETSDLNTELAPSSTVSYEKTRINQLTSVLEDYRKRDDVYRLRNSVQSGTMLRP